MKITKVEIKHFRGFPGSAVYTFDLPGGKNLLLYGENGSGKSSLYHALNQLFNIDVEPPAFSANLFGKDEQDNDVTDGHVTVHLDGQPQVLLTWPQNGARPIGPILERFSLPCTELAVARELFSKFVPVDPMHPIGNRSRVFQAAHGPPVDVKD